MSASEDLIDFEVIETHKENIQALPSGRSAKALARILSPLGVPAQIPDSHDAARAAFEREISTIDESDDPLDIFDRYVKWTLDTYPSAQSTPASQLLPLLERATKAFIKDEQYKNDPRYLKLWLHYIRFFSDAPRETFAYLARHGVGEKLALYYEEFAAWLETNGRYAQAEEMYMMGAELGARPAERLMRKFGEFHKRASARSQDSNGPSSPALPTVRAALVTKVDPFSAVTSTMPDPQAASRNATTTSKKPKMQIFSDDSSSAQPAMAKGGSGWDNIGDLKERKKENTVAAQPWAGQTMGMGSRQNVGMPKMPIFKSQMQKYPSSLCLGHPCLDKVTVNARNGRKECVFVQVEKVYPDDNNPAVEFSFEELRAKRQGWLDLEWASKMKAEKAQRAAHKVNEEPCHTRQILGARNVQPQAAPTQLEPASDEIDLADRIEQSLMINDENAPPQAIRTQKLQIFGDENAEDSHRRVQSTTSKKQKMQIFADENMDMPPPPKPRAKTVPLRDENDASTAQTDRDAELARRLRKEERANRTRKVKVREVKRDDQTIQTKLDSPQGPRLRKRKIAEPTMTIHTKAATDEIYELFNAPLASTSQPQEEQSSEESDEEDEDSEDDDYTSGGESTCTGRISGATSEYGDETQGDLAEAKDAQDEQLEDTSNNTAWSEFTVTKPEANELEEDQTCSAADQSDDERREDTVPPMEKQEEILVEDELATPEAKMIESQKQAPHHISIPPNNYNVPTRPYRDAQQAAYNRLPFMTPIVEKTESSIGTVASRHEKDYFSAKTPCPKTSQKTPTIPEGDDELWSSPFQDTTEQVKEMPKIPPAPAFSKPKPRQPASSAKSTTAAETTKKGPIILDAQCNPMEDSIHATILKEIHPPLNTYEGFHDHGDGAFGRKPEIKKYCKSIANSKGRSNNDKTVSTLVMPPILNFAGCDRTYAIKRELGAGAYAPVYLIEHLDSSTTSVDNDQVVPKMGKGAFGITRRPVEALKTEEPPSAWEFYILSTIHRRLGVSRAAASIIRAFEMHMYTDEGYLVEEYLEHGTLLDLVNIVVAQNAASGGGALDEPLAMFFVVELLRTVEALHAKGIIHGDLKADNVMLRLPTLSTPSDTSAAELTQAYTPTGASNWSSTGISLIDFGRGIDMRAFGPSIQFIADWATTSTDCAEMRELRPWTYQADYHGIAAIAHTLLFGKYIDTVVEKGTGNALGAGSGGKRYKLKEGLKRWWQDEIWSEFFEIMLNSGLVATDGVEGVQEEEGGKLPRLRGMRRCRERMEAWLVENGERGVGLRGMLRRVEGLVGERARRKYIAR